MLTYRKFANIRINNFKTDVGKPFFFRNDIFTPLGNESKVEHFKRICFILTRTFLFF